MRAMTAVAVGLSRLMLLACLLAGCSASVGATSPQSPAASPAQSQAATVSPTLRTLMPTASPTLPPGGITEAQAIALAQQHNSLRTFVSATAGTFADLNIEPQNTGPGIGVTPDQLVWAVRFAGDMTICPPSPGTPCDSPRPGIEVVYLDYRTGAYLMVLGLSPAP